MGSDPQGPFHNWNLKKQIAHIRKCQKDGIACIRAGEPACLADIADHLDIWGPWLCDKIMVLKSEIKTAIDALEYVARHDKDSMLPAVTLDECSTVCKQALAKVSS